MRNVQNHGQVEKPYVELNQSSAFNLIAKVLIIFYFIKLFVFPFTEIRYSLNYLNFAALKKILNKNLLNWLIFIVLSFIWGSSFILMKLGLEKLSSYQVAALRIVSSGVVLLPTAIKFYKLIPADKRFITFMSGVLGSLLPAFLFCKAEEGLDSGLAGTLNALTPIFVIIIGALFFKVKTSTHKVVGIIIAFTGSILLLLSNGISGSQNILYIALIVLATIFYGINVNMVSKNLRGIGSLQIAAFALTTIAFPALLVLIFSGFFNLSFSDPAILKAIGYSAVLGVAGTAFASIIFYKLMKSAGPVFSSMVTYGIPVIAIMWGIWYDEKIGWQQWLCLLVILTGVFVANIETLMNAARNRFAKD